MECTLIKSPFTHIVKLGRVKKSYILYNSLRLKKLFCNKKIVDLVKSFERPQKVDMDSETIKKLYESKFLIDHSTKADDEINLMLKETQLDFKNPTFKVFYLLLTSGCNFRCKYCYLSTLINHKPRKMSLLTAKKSLNLFYKYIKRVNDEQPKIVMYGGEPLMNKEVVKFLVEDVRKKEKIKEIPKTSLIIITNGSLLDDEMCKFLKMNNVLVAVSLDGPKKVNDKNRVTVNNVGTYEIVINALNMLIKNNLKPTISCTINKDNVGRLEKIVKWMIKNFDIHSLGLNLYTGGSFDDKENIKLSKQSAKKIIESFKVCRKNGMYEDTVIRQMKAFVEEKPNIYYCAATGREIAVDPDGNIATCPAVLGNKEFPLNVNQKNLNLDNNAEFKKWVKRTPLLMKECRKCIALGVCGGGCAYNALLNRKTIFAKDDFYCNYAKSVLKWMLEDLNRKR